MKDDWKLLVEGFYPQVQKIQKYIKGPTKKKFPQVIYTSQVISSRCKDNIQTNMNTRNITFLKSVFTGCRILDWQVCFFHYFKGVISLLIMSTLFQEEICCHFKSWFLCMYYIIFLSVFKIFSLSLVITNL